MLLETRNLSKTFNGVYALKNLNMSIKEGEIHGLIGENGAGKSTLIKILGGVYRPDGGEVLWDGKRLLERHSPKNSREMGIQIIYQDPVLVSGFTGIENICMGTSYPMKAGLIQWKKMREDAERKAKELGIFLDLGQLVSDMKPAQKKCVEIIRAMMGECRLLILDEPTAAFFDKEEEMLFALIRRLKEKGTSVLYVSHRLEEIGSLTDRVTVLRNGELSASVKTEETGKEELVRLMSGKTPKTVRPLTLEMQEKGEISLEVLGLSSADGIVKDVSFTAEGGKITGIFGLCGSGRTELLECIYGYRKTSKGTTFLSGRPGPKSPGEAVKSGMAFISEDRRGKGLISGFSVEENLLLSSMDRYTRWGFLEKKAASEKAKGLMEALQIKCTGPGQPVLQLSGGNQQKVVFARAMLTKPSLWLCDEPTQAVDVTAREEIHRLLQEEARKGKAVVYVSSDLTELLEVADQIEVMAAGRIVRSLKNQDLQPEHVLACCYEREGEQ